MAHGTFEVKFLESWQNYFIVWVDASNIYTVRWFSELLFTGGNGTSSRGSSFVWKATGF